MSVILTEEFRTVQQSRFFADMHHFRGNRNGKYLDYMHVLSKSLADLMS